MKKTNRKQNRDSFGSEWNAHSSFQQSKAKKVRKSQKEIGHCPHSQLQVLEFCQTKCALAFLVHCCVALVQIISRSNIWFSFNWLNVWKDYFLMFKNDTGKQRKMVYLHWSSLLLWK